MRKLLFIHYVYITKVIIKYVYNHTVRGISFYFYFLHVNI